MDRILVRLPNKAELVFPAIAVVQGYIDSLVKQIEQGRKHPGFGIRIEAQDDSHLFLSPMLDRLEWWVNGGEAYERFSWDCILDFRNEDRAFAMAKYTEKHIVEIWGTMMGSMPKRVPYMGYLAYKAERKAKFDVLIDSWICEADTLRQIMQYYYPHLTIKVESVAGRRMFQMFDSLCDAKMYIGPRSDASYMAATINKLLLELYPSDTPLWWLSKPICDLYGYIHAKEFRAEDIFSRFKRFERLGIPWLTITDTKNPEGLVLGAQQESTAEVVSER